MVDGVGEPVVSWKKSGAFRWQVIRRSSRVHEPTSSHNPGNPPCNFEKAELERESLRGLSFW